MENTFDFKRNNWLLIAGILFIGISVSEVAFADTSPWVIVSRSILGLVWVIIGNGFGLKKILLKERQLIRTNSLGYKEKTIPLEAIKKANLHQDQIYIFYGEGHEFQITNKQMKMENIESFYYKLQQEMSV